MKLIIIGAGGHGQVIRETARDTVKYRDAEILFLDDRYEVIYDQLQMYGTVSYRLSGKCDSFLSYREDDTEFYPAFGNNQLRLNWEKKILEAGGKLATIIHPRAYVAQSATVQPGSVVLANAIVNTGTTIGRACIINVGAIVEHGCVVSDGCHVNSGAVVMAENFVPCCTKVDSGEVIPVRKWSECAAYIEEV